MEPNEHTPPTIRTAGSRDVEALRRLAQLESARPLTGQILLAELDGAPIAAVSLETGAAIADPFRHTAQAVELLMQRRYRIVRQHSEVGQARSLLRRLAPRHGG
jgi:hypothetical protein